MFRTVSMRVAIRELTSGVSAQQTDRDEKTIPVTRIETVGDGFLHREKLGFVDPSSVPDRFLCRAGDIIYSNINSTPMIGRCAQVSEDDLPVAVGMNTLRIRPNLNRFDQRFFFWALYSEFMKAQARAWSKPAINQASLPQSSIKALKIPMPPLGDQQTIANYLDHETAEIDAFIADQERLIELLEERRAATITHAVTKGLDPKVPMKDSGIAWLGNVPEDWEITPLKWISQLVTGTTPSTTEESHYADDVDGFPWIRPEDIDESGRPTVASKTLSSTGRELVRILPPKTVLLVCIGATLGKVGITADKTSTNQQITAIYGKGIESKYLFFTMQAAYPEIRLTATGTTLPILNSSRLGSLRVPLPSAREQQLISTYLERETSAIDAAISDVREAIALSRERRAALISAAVTGQLDVSQAQRPVDEVLEQGVQV